VITSADRPVPARLAAAGRAVRVAAQVTTGLFVLVIATFGVLYELSAAPVAESIHRLGYPDYVMRLNGTAKLIGGVALLVPGAPRLREWAYAGFTCMLVPAFFSHVFSHDTFANALHPVILGAVLAASYVLRRRIELSSQS
jgi:hypothetical protein